MSIIAHVHRRFLRATPDQVWTAITDTDRTRQYLHAMAYAEPPEAGRPFRTVLPSGEPVIEGEIEEFDPPRLLVQTWRVVSDPALAREPPGRVEWHLEPVGEKVTLLRLVHGDLAFSPFTWAAVKDDWVRVLDSLKSLLETGEPLPEVAAGPPVAAEPGDGDWHRAQAVEANNDAWELIEWARSDSGPQADGEAAAGADTEAGGGALAGTDVASDADLREELLRRVYAAAYHWDRASGRTPENAGRAAYMIAKGLLIAGRPEAALEAADRTLAICLRHNLADFDLAYAHEARARALAALGRTADSDEAWATARAVPIADDEDREILLRDFADC